MKNIRKIKKLLAFTLAELLLALSVLGIVVALVLPGIKNIQPDKEVVVLKKGYLTATRTVGSMIANDDLYPEDSTNSTISSNFANTSEVTYRGQKFSGTNKFCKLFAAHVNVKGTPTDDCSFDTLDGIHWSINASDTNNIKIKYNSTAKDIPNTVFEMTVNKYGVVKMKNDDKHKKILNIDLTK